MALVAHMTDGPLCLFEHGVYFPRTWFSFYLLPPISSLFRMSDASTSTSSSQTLSLSMPDPKTQALKQ